MLPNLVITGFPKCGTTSLFTWLADHPQVTGSTVKETNFFVDPGTHSFRSHANFRDHGLAGYKAYFQKAQAEKLSSRRRLSTLTKPRPSRKFQNCQPTRH